MARFRVAARPRESEPQALRIVRDLGSPSLRDRRCLDGSRRLDGSRWLNGGWWLSGSRWLSGRRGQDGRRSDGELSRFGRRYGGDDRRLGVDATSLPPQPDSERHDDRSC